MDVSAERRTELQPADCNDDMDVDEDDCGFTQAGLRIEQQDEDSVVDTSMLYVLSPQDRHCVDDTAIASLQNLPTDAMNLVLAFLTFAEFQALSVLSKTLHAAIGRSRHLYVSQHGSYQRRKRRAFVSSGSTVASDLFSPIATNHAHINNNINNSASTTTTATMPSTSTADVTSTVTTLITPTTTAEIIFFSTSKLQPSDLNLPQQDFQRLLNRYRDLNVLSLHSGLAAVGDRVIGLLNTCPAASTLQSLHLHGCALSYWCHEWLDLPELRHISITGCGAIRVSAARLLRALPRLSSLELGQSTTLREDTVQTMGGDGMIWSGQLQKLILRQCVRLRRPQIRFENLTHLSLAGCFSLVDLPEIHCPNLRHLDFSFCVRLRTASLYQILRKLPGLQRLDLVECISLDSLQLKLAELTWLNIGFCSSMIQLELDCPNLEQLENSSCLSLSKFILHRAPKLRLLDLSFLSRLRHVEVDAPGLERLGLEECRRLEFVHGLICPQLQTVKVHGSKMTAHRFNRYIRQTMVQGWSSGSNGTIVEAPAIRL